MGKHYLDNKNNNIKFVGSLNSDKRRRDLKKITDENSAILKRIQSKQPVYNHLKWEQEWSKSRKWITDKTSILPPVNQGAYNPMGSFRRSKTFQDSNGQEEVFSEEEETVDVYENQGDEAFEDGDFEDMPSEDQSEEPGNDEPEQPHVHVEESKVDETNESKVELNETFEKQEETKKTTETKTETEQVEKKEESHAEEAQLQTFSYEEDPPTM